MKKWTLVIVILVVIAIAFGGMTLAKGKPFPQKCPWSDLNCLDVWDPVYCDGVVYSNSCYALRACAKTCVSGIPY